MDPHDLQPPGADATGRLAVVSGYAHNPLTPRGQRTQRLVERLGEDWDVGLVGLPPDVFSQTATPSSGRVLWRKLAGNAVGAALLDKWEPWSARRLGGWAPAAEAALLIACPWSPVLYAARRLRRAGIPYVLDAGDPWGLTAPAPIGQLVSRRRWRQAERFLWSGASGAVVTTRQQAEVLAGHFPALPILVRPNGYEDRPAPPGAAVEPKRPDPRCLRLVHYGSLLRLRVDVIPLLQTLVDSGRWGRIELTQLGEDQDGMLRRAPEGVEIEWAAPRPWGEVLADAGEFDLAIVVGNVLPGQLPSKAIQYMTLPIPRLAVTLRPKDDALADYVRDRPGWATVQWDDPDADRAVWDHLARDWDRADLDPPQEESWPVVADQIVEFFSGCVRSERNGPTATAADRVHGWA